MPEINREANGEFSRKQTAGGCHPHESVLFTAASFPASSCSPHNSTPAQAERSFLNRMCFRLQSYLNRAQPYLGLVYFTTLIILLITLAAVSCCWICIFRDVHYCLSRTFAWEFITQMLGSYYNDCVDRSNGDSVGIRMAPSEQCPYSVTTPWIPLVGVGIGAGIEITVISLWIYRLIRRKRNSIHWTGSGGGKCKVVLVFLGMTACLFYGQGTANVNGIGQWIETKLLGRMQFAMQLNKNVEERMLYQVDYRWEVTQYRLKCCGIEGTSDWKFGLFSADHAKDLDPRYPKSCCNTDKVFPRCLRFPTRYQTWEEGCYQKELATVKSYEHQSLLLLGFTWAFVLLVIVIFWLLENFLEGQPLIPAGLCVNFSMFGRTFHFGPTPITSDQDAFGNTKQPSKVLLLEKSCVSGENVEEVREPEKDMSKNPPANTSNPNCQNKTDAKKPIHYILYGEGSGSDNDIKNKNSKGIQGLEPQFAPTVVEARNKDKSGQLDIKPLYTRRFSKINNNKSNPVVPPIVNQPKLSSGRDNDTERIMKHLETWV